MRRNKPKYQKKKKNLNHGGSRKDAYLPRESTSDSLYSFDEIEEHDLSRYRENDQFWEATEASEYQLDRNKRLLDVTALPLRTHLSSEFKTTDVFSLQDVSKNNSSAEEDEVSALADLIAFSSNMETVSQECKNQIPRYKRTETTDVLDKFQSRTMLDDKQQIHHSKDFARTNNNDNKTTGSLPFLPKTRQDCKRNLSGKKHTSKGKECQSNDSGIGIVSGKKLADSLSPEFYNLRTFLPLLTLCQCPDYDSAVIEAVRDYNDPACRGVTSQIYSPY